MFTSQLYTGETVLDDDYAPEHEIFVTPDGLSRGLDLGLRSSFDDYAYGDAAKPFPDSLLIPEGDWEGMIKEMEERKTRLSDLIEQAGLPCKDQAQTNYCWINAPAHCVEISRLKQGQKMVILSAASAGAKIKNFRNVGGWGKEGLEFIAENGLVPEEFWPKNAINRAYDTAQNWEFAQRYRVEKWLEIRPRNLKQLMSCLLRRIPIAVGYNWWGHEVTLVDPVWVNGAPGGRMRNSWTMDWPKPQAKGYAVLQGSKLLPDDAVCPLSTTAA
jgi:hypothetical protein